MVVYSTELSQVHLSLAGKEENLGNLEFTYTADGGGMAVGSKVEITIPGWLWRNVPFEPASDQDNRSGAVTLRSVADTESDRCWSRVDGCSDGPS